MVEPTADAAGIARSSSCSTTGVARIARLLFSCRIACPGGVVTTDGRSYRQTGREIFTPVRSGSDAGAGVGVASWVVSGYDRGWETEGGRAMSAANVPDPAVESY